MVRHWILIPALWGFESLKPSLIPRSFRGGYFCIAFVETYRSGHNEPHSKCGYPFWVRGFESHRLRLYLIPALLAAGMLILLGEDKELYSFDSVIRYSETDKNQKLSVGSLVNYFQDCSNFQSSYLKVGVDELASAKRAWILSYWQIVIRRMPEFGENITTGTWAYEFERFIGKRNFIMLDGNKETVACADSVWVFIDTDTGKPAKADERFSSGYGIEPRFADMEYEPRKIKCAADWEERGSFVVRRYYLDTNNHVNNARYIQLAQELLPDEASPKMIRAEYKRPAFYGDTIQAFTGMSDTGRFQVDLRDDAGHTYVLVEFAL